MVSNRTTATGDIVAVGGETGLGDARPSCGLVAGFIVTAALNPWDRALFLSVVNRRPFFSSENWQRPYRGVVQTLAQRSVSSGLYFPLEDLFTHALGSPLLGGQAAGVALGVALNPLSFVKFQCWGATSRNFMSMAREIYRDAGAKGFFRGVISTTCRDSVFGICFAMRRCFPAERGSGYETSHNFAVGAGFAALGTAASSPFNYIRSMAYAEKTKVPMETMQQKRDFCRKILSDLEAEIHRGGKTSWFGGLAALQQRMKLGFGTLRVAVGMALTDQIYRALCRAAAAE